MTIFSVWIATNIQLFDKVADSRNDKIFWANAINIIINMTKKEFSAFLSLNYDKIDDLLRLHKIV